MQIDEDDLVLKTITERHSSRGPFDPNRPVARADLLKVLEAAKWTPTAHNMQNFEIVVVEDKETLEAISKVESPVNEAFIRENYAQLSFSEEEWLAKKTGILGTFFPDYMLHPDEPIDEAAMEEEGFSQGSLVSDSPVLLVVLFDPRKRAPASEGDFLGIMSLGCLMENMWLAAQSVGLAFHIVSEYVDEPAMGAVKQILHIPDELKIGFSVRLGYPAYPEAGLRVRRDVADFTHLDQYGEKMPTGDET